MTPTFNRPLCLILAAIIVLAALCFMPPAHAEAVETQNVYLEKDLKDFSITSPALYKAKTINNACTLYSERSKESPRVYSVSKSRRIDILYVGIVWCIGRYEDKIGYIKRDRLEDIKVVDPENTPPYGVISPVYITKTVADCPIHKAMKRSSDVFVTLNPGTPVTIIGMKNGWAIVIYMREYGYIESRLLTSPELVADADNAKSGTPIASYTSFYKMTDSEENNGRIYNIGHAAETLCMTIASGEKFDYNAQIGPFRESNGYKKAPVLKDGTTVLGSGGGVCQVSSTLYCALLQLPGIGILQRRAHGPSGASYLPHGVDAASGSTNLNLRFKNMYEFPIRIEAVSNGDGALTVTIYRR